jgi:tetratricopeptide (TPR) repeat protein
MLGWVRQRRGSRDDIQIAEKIFRSLLDKRGKEQDYRAQLGLAEALERKGILYRESADAIASGERVSEASDPEQRVKRMRADAEAFWDESVAMYKAVLERRPEETQVLNGLQRVHALRGEDEKALRWSLLLLEQNERDLQFWRQRLQQPDLTADEDTDVRELMGRTTRLQVETHLQATTLLVRLARKPEAIGHLDSVLVLAPELANAYSRRAEILHALGRDEEAVPNIDEFLRLSKLKFEHPDIRRAFELRAECEAAIEAKQVDSAR